MDEQEERAALEREIQQLREELASVDELPRENRPGSVSDLKGASDITTSVSKGIRSIPVAHDRYYLDLYLLQKERDRLAKETTSIKKRRMRIGRKLGDIGKDMASKEQMAIQQMTILTGQPHPAQGSQPETPPKKKKPAQKKYEYKEEQWKQISINY